MICLFNFLIFLAVCLNISTVINIKILTNSNQQTQSYKFTSFSFCGFDHRDAWNLHTNIIRSKHSTDFKELSPCSVWYHLKLTFSCSEGQLRFPNCINGLMVSMFTLSVINSGSEPQLGQSKYYTIGICCFYAKNAA